MKILRYTHNLTLLNLRNTPRGHVSSPAQILMGRTLRTNIPMKRDNIKPKVTLNKDWKEIQRNKIRSKEVRTYTIKTQRMQAHYHTPIEAR